MQVKDESPEHHEIRAKHYIKAKGWDLVKIYRLDGVSGKTVMKHSETQRMLADLKSGVINGLVFSKLAGKKHKGTAGVGRYFQSLTSNF